MKLVFLGPPGVGKGTQARLFCSKVGFAHVSTGDMLRVAVKAGSALGREVKSIIENGSLVSDELIIRMIEVRVSDPDCAEGFVLDGFPRTLAQAHALQSFVERRRENIDRVVLFDVSEVELLKRLSGRRQLENRVDDNFAVQRDRLRVYEQQTVPVCDYYEKLGLLARIDSAGTVDSIQRILCETLGL